MLPDPRVDRFEQLWILLAHRDRQFSTGSHRDICVHGQPREHFLPELREVVVRDGDRDEAGADHLEDVIVFEDDGESCDHHGRLAAGFELLVQLGKALGIEALFADEYLLAGQIVERRDRWRARPGYHDFAHIGPGRLRKARECPSLGRHRQHRGDEVDLAGQEGRGQLIARQRHGRDVHLEVAGLQVGVQIVLELLDRLVGQAALLSLVDEVMGAVEGHPHANHAALDHLV